MAKIIIFGAGYIGRILCSKSYIREDIVAVVDNNPKLWDSSFLGYTITSPETIKNIVYDYVVIAVGDENIDKIIEKQLFELSVDADKIMRPQDLMKVIVCGDRDIEKIYSIFDIENRVIAYLADDKNSEKSIYGHNVISFNELKNIPYYGFIIICDTIYSQIDNNIEQRKKLNILYDKLISMDIPANKILWMSDYLYTSINEDKERNIIKIDSSRKLWIKDYANLINSNNIEGNVAECGVFRGDTAKFINDFFPDRKLYLFDTFEGFDKNDLNIEVSLNNNFLDGKYDENQKYFSDTNIDIVINKMNHPENIIIKKGYFPESAKDVDDKFCFVNLDMDLYKPMLEGLRFFYDRLSEGGCILLHDYFNRYYPGVMQAVKDFEKERNIQLRKTIIGDDYSIAILK